MPMATKHPYIAYLVRLWQARHAGALVWRASLEDPHTGELQGFSDIESLFAHLRKQAEDQAKSQDSRA
jgi:hypothetical protein